MSKMTPDPVSAAHQQEAMKIKGTACKDYANQYAKWEDQKLVLPVPMAFEFLSFSEQLVGEVHKS